MSSSQSSGFKGRKTEIKISSAEQNHIFLSSSTKQCTELVTLHKFPAHVTNSPFGCQENVRKEHNKISKKSETNSAQLSRTFSIFSQKPNRAQNQQLFINSRHIVTISLFGCRENVRKMNETKFSKKYESNLAQARKKVNFGSQHCQLLVILYFLSNQTGHKELERERGREITIQRLRVEIDGLRE